VDERLGSVARGLVGGWREWRKGSGWRWRQSPFKREHGEVKRKEGARFDGVHAEGGGGVGVQSADKAGGGSATLSRVVAGEGMRLVGVQYGGLQWSGSQGT
jgi:hypothetical protein